MGATHRGLGAVAAKFFFREARDDDRQFVRGQGVGVMQHRRDRQVLTTDGAIDDDLKALHRSEHIDGAPIAAGPVVIED